MSIHSLHEKAISLAREYLRCERDLIDILQQLDQEKGAQKLGYRSLFDYSTHALGLSESVSYALITVARKATLVPELKQCIADGEITLSNAKRIAPILTPANQAQWLERAKTLPRAKLEAEIAREYPREAKPERVTPIAENLLSMQITITAELYEQLKRIQDLESSRTGKPASLEDAIHAAAATHLHKHDPIQKAQRARATESEITRPGTSAQGARTAIPAALEHAVILRDGAQCTAQTPRGRCEARRWLHIHHLQPISEGGDHSLENLATFCFAHHQAHHDPTD